MRCKLSPIRLLALVALLPVSSAAQPGRDSLAPPGNRPSLWWYFDGPLWDISNEGLPFRFTVALPAPRDPLARWLMAHESRWTMSVGYARVYDSYDRTTGIFKNPGGHAALFSAGRQTIWQFPDFLGRFTPRLSLELGVHYATARFPADGTRPNFKVITGFEWTHPRADGDAWIGGIHWPHFSNANLLSRNAGYDGLTFRVGRSVSF